MTWEVFVLLASLNALPADEAVRLMLSCCASHRFAFCPEVTIIFPVTEDGAGHYHVPLLRAGHAVA